MDCYNNLKEKFDKSLNEQQVREKEHAERIKSYDQALQEHKISTTN